MKSEFKTVFYKFFIRSFYFTLLLISLLGPSFGNVKKEIKSLSKEIYIVSDVSLSMDATDIPPSRLEKSKQVLKQMVNAFNSDRIGLIIFGSTAHVQCPPTFDQSALLLFIETLNSNLVPEAGSNVSMGLQLALDQHQNSTPTDFNKVILLITDGEDFSEKIMEIASSIKNNNIHFLVLGIGTKKGSKIPISGTFKKDKAGNTVITRLENKQLKQITEEAGGSYFEINEHSNETDFLINAVNNIEGAVSDTKEVDASANKYMYFLSIALIFIILDVLITVRTVKI